MAAMGLKLTSTPNIATYKYGQVGNTEIMRKITSTSCRKASFFEGGPFYGSIWMLQVYGMLMHVR